MPVFRLICLAFLACAWCSSLLLCRLLWSESLWFKFMIWNLFLAAIPLGFSVLLPFVRRWVFALPLLVGWLLFLPNAPYMLTDLIHLRQRPGVPVWFDLLMLQSFALVALWMGFESLRLVQHWMEERSSKVFSWLFVFACLLLSGFGIYLGRFLRRNSWDILGNPKVLFNDILDRVINPMAHGSTWGVTFGYGGLLIVCYLAFKLGTCQAQQTPESSNSTPPSD